MVNQFLWMFNPDPERKRLGFDQDILLVEQMKNVPCGMTRCQDDSVAGKLVAVCRADGLDHLVPENEADHFLLKEQDSAAVGDLLPHRLDDLREFVGTDMRMGIDKDRRRSAELNQQIQDTPDIPPLCTTGI